MYVNQTYMKVVRSLSLSIHMANTSKKHAGDRVFIPNQAYLHVSLGHKFGLHHADQV